MQNPRAENCHVFQNTFVLPNTGMCDGIVDSGMEQFLLKFLNGKANSAPIFVFLIQIVFLNMLIAIMGDTYAQASENQENNARITKLEIMEDYIHLIVHDIKNSNREITSEEADEDSPA